MHVILWLAVGLALGLTGWGLGRRRSFGPSSDIVVAMIGSLVAGWVARREGLTGAHAMATEIAIACAGAVMLVTGLRGVYRLAERMRAAARRRRGDTAVLPEDLGTVAIHELQRLQQLLRLHPMRANPNDSFDEQLTLGQRVADRVAVFGGSWTFIGLFLLFMFLWMAWNTELAHFDPFPFILLNLMLSCVAALQAPVIMMSQNRQALKDRHDVEIDHAVNLRAEAEIHRLNERFEAQCAVWERMQAEWAEQRAMVQSLVLQRRRRAGSSAPPPRRA